MSASAVPVPSSPASRNNNSLSLDSDLRPNARRRQVVYEKKITATEMVSEGGAADDRSLANGKDPSHTIRGESPLERPRDLSRRGVAAISPRRRKSTLRPEKPRWQTTLSILAKNAVLLMVLSWLGQAMWRWNRLVPNTDASFAALEFENRISEVEMSLKKTAKMTQVQLDAIDKRMKQVEGKGSIFEKELRKVAARSDELDKFIGELRDANYLSKTEFETFVNELKETSSFEGSGKGLSLDDVGSYAREVVIKEIEKHAADGLGQVDYALASGGGRVVKHSEPYNSGKPGSWFPVAKVRNGVHGYAQKMLEPSFGEPGQCFALKGSSGFVDIKLRAGIIPDSITLEHVAKNVAYDRSSAPKDCRVSGWYESLEDKPSNPSEMMPLLEFTYDLEKSNAQTFNIESVGPGVVNVVRLEFTSNHGSTSHTCIYRFRVHGYDPGTFMSMTA